MNGQLAVFVVVFLVILAYVNFALHENQQKKRSRQRKMKAYDMSSLSDYLPQLKAPRESTPTEFKLNSKRKNSLVMKESHQLKTVINHPYFQSDPLGSIFQHLRNTQPTMDEQPKRRVKTGKKKAK